jgi:nitroreductase
MIFGSLKDTAEQSFSYAGHLCRTLLCCSRNTLVKDYSQNKIIPENSSKSSMEQPVQNMIKTRRSIREFTSQPVERSLLLQIISAGIWAPSGLNNQPWRFVLIRDDALRERLAGLTHYAHIVKAAPALIAVYLDQEKMYDRVKDHQAVGACIQNMLLAACELGLGAVWLGQILANKDQVSAVLGLNRQYELAALLALGHPLHHDQQSQRQPLETFILHEFGGTAP